MTGVELQRDTARALGNYVRHANAGRRDAIGDLSQGDGMRAVADLLEARPADGELIVRGSDSAGAWRVSMLLAAPLRMGPGRARRVMQQAGVFRPQVRVRELTDRERASLVVQLRKQADAADARPLPTTTVLGDENHG